MCEFEVERLTDAARIKELQVQLKEIAYQALATLQLDFGYSPKNPCTLGNCPVRHLYLWGISLKALDGQIPDVEEHREWKGLETG